MKRSMRPLFLSFLIVVILFACLLTCNAQTLEIQGDTAIVLIEQGQKIELDSSIIAKQLGFAKQRISEADNQLLKIKALQADALEQKSKEQSTLTYFLEIREKYNQLKLKLNKK